MELFENTRQSESVDRILQDEPVNGLGYQLAGACSGRRHCGEPASHGFKDRQAKPFN